MRPRRSTIPFLVLLTLVVFVGGALAPAISASGPPRPSNDGGSPGKQTGAVHSEAGRLVTGPPERLQSVVAGTPPTAILAVNPVNPPSGMPAYPAGVTIVGNELRAESGGFRAWFNVQVSDWDPMGDGPNLSVYQVMIDCSGFMDSDFAGDQPDLLPAGWTDLDVRGGIACPGFDPTPCVTAFGESWASCPDELCDPGYMSSVAERADSWCAASGGGCISSGVAANTCYFKFFSVSNAIPGHPDQPSTCVGGTRPGQGCTTAAQCLGGGACTGPGLASYYGGTLVLDIPPGAKGKYTVLLNPDETFVSSPGTPPEQLESLAETGFVVTILTGQCCDPGVTPAVCISDQFTRSECDASGGVFDPTKTCADGCQAACCLPGGSCELRFPADCSAAGGVSTSVCLGDIDESGRDDACEGFIPEGPDCLKTVCGGRTRVSFADNPIPADFFGPQSQPFNGTIELGGSASGPGSFDTRIMRLNPMLPDLSDSTPIELVQLNLANCEEIEIVTGGSPVLWNVQVGLSTVAAPVGNMTVTKAHTNGGSFQAQFSVQARFMFSAVNDAGQIRILDTGQAGQPPVTLSSLGSSPWVHALKGGTTALTCGENFIPGIEEDPLTETQCCRKVGHAGPGHLHETAPPNCSGCPTVSGACCDPNTGACSDVAGAPNCPGGDYKGDGSDCDDTDGDGLADVVEGNFTATVPGDRCNVPTDPLNPDTDGDGCPDGDEVTNGTNPKDPLDPPIPCGAGAADCNNNGTPDVVDIATPGGSDDCQPNGIPDECEDGACCYKPFGSAVCFPGPKLGGISLDPPDSCEQANWYPGGSVWLGPCVSCDSFQDAVLVDEGGTIFHHQVGQPTDCPSPDHTPLSQTAGICPPPATAGLTPPPKLDPWVSQPLGGGMCEQFGTGDAPVIPAGTFGPGSDAFSGTICFEGAPLGDARFGDADTIIERTVDPFDRCALPSSTEVQVAVEIAALSLADTAPITVTYDGGQNPEQWNVKVGLSTTAVPQPGTLTAIKTHCNGGTYTNSLNVQPLFSFTKVANPGTSIEWDPDPDGLSPVLLGAAAPQHWVGDLDPAMGVMADVCSNFHAGVQESAPQMDCDCNGNGRRDLCDIEETFSADCNLNGIPDECDISFTTSDDCNENDIPDDCEPDCNGNGRTDSCDLPPPVGLCSVNCSANCNENGMPDECEPDCNGNGRADACDLALNSSQDCTLNGRPDECDLGAGATADCQRNQRPDPCDLAIGVSSDANGDNIPDECGFAPPQPPLRFPPDTDGTRALGMVVQSSATASGPATVAALRVKLIDLQNPIPPNLPQFPPPNFSSFESGTCTAVGEANGCARWVGKPGTFLEAQDNPLGATYRAARLQCTPYYADWASEGIFYVTAAEIVPSSTYNVESFAASCQGYESTCTAVSAPLTISTARSGDVEVPFNPPSTTTQPDVTDVAQLVNKFKSLPGAPIKAIAQLQPNLPELNADINALDIVAVVDAVKQRAYAFGGPCPCPSTMTCESMGCSSPTPCVTAFGTGATCVKTCSGPGPLAGDPCISNSHCVGSGTCGAGFCRDRCGRCTP